jgi:hypothetical protein
VVAPPRHLAPSSAWAIIGGLGEAAGVNSAAGSFGLSFGLAVAGGIMLAVLSFNFNIHDGIERSVVNQRWRDTDQSLTCRGSGVIPSHLRRDRSSQINRDNTTCRGHVVEHKTCRGAGRDRTCDRGIMSPLL